MPEGEGKGGRCMSIMVDGQRVPLSVGGVEKFAREHGDAGKKLAEGVRQAFERGDGE